MLEAKGLLKSFKKKTALDHITLSLVPGVYGLLGPNGAGKTTLIRCLTNLYKYKGKILVDGKDIQKNRDYMRNIGYLPQKFGVYNELTTEENLRYFCELKGISRDERDAEIERVLKLVNLFDVKKKKAKALSGGMLRRLGIAQVLLGDPGIMIFDEPTAGLDPEERLRFKMIVSALPKNKIILISTHIVEDVDALCSQIIIMNEGKVHFKGDGKSLKQLAQKKTFECSAEEIGALKGRYFVERQFELDEEVMYRFVANEPQDCAAVKPRIEDGYICVLEKI